jgi:hypothetical protein
MAWCFKKGTALPLLNFSGGKDLRSLKVQGDGRSLFRNMCLLSNGIYDKRTEIRREGVVCMCEHWKWFAGSVTGMVDRGWQVCRDKERFL